MKRIIQIAVVSTLAASPALAAEERFDLTCHGTHTVSYAAQKQSSPIELTLSVDLAKRELCEQPCRYTGHISTQTPDEITVKGLKSRAAALDEVQAYAHGAINLDAVDHDEQHSELRLALNSGRLKWTSPIRLKGPRKAPSESVIEASCTRAPYTGARP